MRDVKIKAKITNYDNICKVAEELSGGPPTIVNQNDTFYRVPKGRLRMRNYANSSATLLWYDLSDENHRDYKNFELLSFSVYEIVIYQALNEMLTKCLGVIGRVVKERKLYMVDQTRIHIDTVQDLGHYMELEVVLRHKQTLEEGQAIARDLQIKLGVKDKDIIVNSTYVDMLHKRL